MGRPSRANLGGFLIYIHGRAILTFSKKMLKKYLTMFFELCYNKGVKKGKGDNMTKYLIDDEIVSEKDFFERLEEEVNDYVEYNYDDILDECYPSYKMCDIEFYASQILKECDPIAYNCGISDEKSNRLEEAKDELEYGEFVINGITFEIVEEEDDEEDE